MSSEQPAAAGGAGTRGWGTGLRLVISALLSAMLVVPLACGGGSAPNVNEPNDTLIEPSTVGEAQSAFDAAERQLQQELVVRSDGPPAPAPQPPGPSPHSPQVMPSPAPSPGYPQGDPGAGWEHDDEAFAAAQSRCARACRALASMTRSANRLCALDGEETHRCRNVRQRVDAARRLVTAMCPDCR